MVKSPYTYVNDAIEMAERRDLNDQAKWSRLRHLLLQARHAFDKERRRQTITDLFLLLFLGVTSAIGVASIIAITLIKLGYLTPCL